MSHVLRLKHFPYNSAGAPEVFLVLIEKGTAVCKEVSEKLPAQTSQTPEGDFVTEQEPYWGERACWLQFSSVRPQHTGLGAQATRPLLPAASPEQGQASGRHRPSPSGPLDWGAQARPEQTRDRPWWRVAGRPYLWITDAESFSRFRRFLSA